MSIHNVLHNSQRFFIKTITPYEGELDILYLFICVLFLFTI